MPAMPLLMATDVVGSARNHELADAVLYFATFLHRSVVDALRSSLHVHMRAEY